MCRNIRVLHHFAPPTTEEEIRAASLQYVRKVSGALVAPKGTEEAFAAAIDAVATATANLLRVLPHRGEARTREGERVKAKLRWEKRSSGR